MAKLKIIERTKDKVKWSIKCSKRLKKNEIRPSPGYPYIIVNTKTGEWYKRAYTKLPIKTKNWRFIYGSCKKEE